MESGYVKSQDMTLTIICPNLLCRGILQVPDSVRGRKVRCGKCGKDFLVPAAQPNPTNPSSETASVAAAAASEKTE